MNKLKGIMLVDDDDTNNLLNSLFLKDLNAAHQIIVKSGAKEALEYLKECIARGLEAPELILLDINMPEMSGYDFIVEFNKLSFVNIHPIRVVMLSALISYKDSLRLKELGIDEFMEKPMTSEKVWEIIFKLRLLKKEIT